MRKLILPLTAALSLTAASLITAHSYAEDAIMHAAGYLTVENTGSEPDRLISVTSDASPDVEIHEMKMEGDVMKMRKLADGLDIPAGGKVELKPGGCHLMFMAVPAPFKQGAMVKVTLKFEKAGDLEVTLPVAAADATGPGEMHGG
jgi:periplasmic copper chaperone A